VIDVEDPTSLIGYLRDARRIGADETPRIHVLPGGVSNKTVLVERDNGDAWVIKQALLKLRVKTDWFSDPARIRREAEALRWLPRFAPPGTITPLIFEDAEENLLAMAAVPQPHENWKSMLLAGRLENDHVEQFATLLAEIHRKSAEASEEVSKAFDDRSFFESLRLEPYYAYTSGQVGGAAAEFLHNLIARTRERRFTLVHGDFSPKNVLVRDGRLILLDHEVVHFGDPAFDVGFAVAHFLSKANHLPEHSRPFALAVERFWQTYQDAIGYPPWREGLRARAIAHAMGCLLARVAGRSPLEYLDADARERQRAVTEKMMSSSMHGDFRNLATGFLFQINQWRPSSP
jgi:aminoglycoside phosphotransferase (APT) family kinase protein